jgi:hypothetical protein
LEFHNIEGKYSLTLAEALQIKQKDSMATFRRSGKKFIIYGAGNVGKDLLDIFSRHKLQVKYFIDINAINDQRIKNIPVITPEKAKSLKKEDVCVVIGLFNSLINAADIKKPLKATVIKLSIIFLKYFIFLLMNWAAGTSCKRRITIEKIPLQF